MCGTPAYSAPKVLTQQHYDFSADLWSIIVIAFECLTTETIYAKVIEYIRSEQDGEFKPAIPDGTSALLSDLLTRLLQFDPRQRFEFDAFYHHPFIRPTLSKAETPDVSTVMPDDAPGDSIDQVIMYLEAIQANIQGLCKILKRMQTNDTKATNHLSHNT